MTGESPLPPAEDEISVLDLLLVVAENARLLIFGPRCLARYDAQGNILTDALQAAA
ncbi:MAG: hypothetical protein ACREVG_13845 [Burkholderiales bacterium]